MLIDHITAMFVPQTGNVLFTLSLFEYQKEITWYVIGRSIGRIAFPLFAFLVVQGYLHTKNLKKYILRLSVFALLSELPYYYALCFDPVNHLSINRRNVIFTLLLGLITVAIIDHIHQTMLHSTIKTLLQVMALVGMSFLLIYIHGTYQEMGYGILLMAAFYFGREHKKTLLLLFILTVGFLRGDIEFMAIIAAPFLYYYNGKKGPSFQYGFYIFYPAHLLLLCGIRAWLVH